MRNTHQERLYNQIMSNISKSIRPIIEAAMNETEDNDIKSEIKKAADAICATNKTKGELQGAINMLKAASGDGKGFGNFRYKGVLLKDLIPELERRLNDDNKTLINDSYRTRKYRRY